MPLTPAEFKAARQELLVGFPPSEQRKLFALLLGYNTGSRNRIISGKERGEESKPITYRDELVIFLLRRIKQREGNLMEIISWVIDQVETQT